jgi:hypothetical protein
MQFDFEKVSLKISGKALIFIKMQITKVNFDEFFFVRFPRKSYNKEFLFEACLKEISYFGISGLF